MDSEKTLGFPLRYDVADYSHLPFWPFIVAPLQESQQTIIFGPSEVDVNDLVADVKRPLGVDLLVGPLVRVSRAKTRLCVAITFPTAARDDAGRQGLSCTVGLLAPYGASPRDLAAYLYTVFQMLRAHLALDLLRGESALLIERLYAPDSRHVIAKPLLNAMHGVLMIASVCARTTPFGRTSISDRWRRWLAKLKRSPKVIMYDPLASMVDVIEILAREIGSGHACLSPTRGAEATMEDEIIIARLPSVTAGAHQVTLRKTVSGKRYLLFS